MELSLVVEHGQGGEDVERVVVELEIGRYIQLKDGSRVD